MADSATRTLLALVACNTTEQCASMEASATCADHLCVCPSFQPLTEARRCNTTDSNLSLALGASCSINGQCPHMAACLDGRCHCPQGYQPSDGRHCHAIRQSGLSVASWMAIMILTSGFLFILLLIVYVYVLGQRRPAHTSTMMYGQASTKPTPSIFLVPVTTMAPGDEAYDSVRISTELGASGTFASSSSTYPGPVESWQARLALAANEASSVSERSDQRRSRSDSSIPRVRSAKKPCTEYPLLRNISAPSRRSCNQARRKTGTASEKGHVRRKKDRELSSLPDMKDQRRREDRSSSADRHAVTPPLNQRRHAADADAPDDSARLMPENSSSYREELAHSTLTWGSIGRSLDSLLSIPVVARVHTCASTTRTTLESERDLVFSADKL